MTPPSSIGLLDECAQSVLKRQDEAVLRTRVDRIQDRRRSTADLRSYQVQHLGVPTVSETKTVAPLIPAFRHWGKIPPKPPLRWCWAFRRHGAFRYDRSAF
jgi:hypothetical protein